MQLTNWKQLMKTITRLKRFLKNLFMAGGIKDGLHKLIIWKIVLVVEFLGRGSGMGFQIHSFFLNYEMAHILAYTILLIVIMLFIDYLIMKPLEKFIFDWRQPLPQQ